MRFLHWSQGGEDYREDDQSVVEPEDHSQGEDLEEGEKDVARGHGAESQGQEGCQPAVENCGADGDQSSEGLLQSITCRQLQWRQEITYTELLLPLETR